MTAWQRVCAIASTPSMLLGGTGEAIVGIGQEIEEPPAVSLWLAHMDGVRLIPMHLQLERTPDGASIVGWPDELSQDWPNRRDHACDRGSVHVSRRPDGGATQ